jgi:hypothetical protein
MPAIVSHSHEVIVGGTDRSVKEGQVLSFEFSVLSYGRYIGGRTTQNSTLKTQNLCELSGGFLSWEQELHVNWRHEYGESQSAGLP